MPNATVLVAKKCQLNRRKKNESDEDDVIDTIGNQGEDFAFFCFWRKGTNCVILDTRIAGFT